MILRLGGVDLLELGGNGLKLGRVKVDDHEAVIQISFENVVWPKITLIR